MIMFGVSGRGNRSSVGVLVADARGVESADFLAGVELGAALSSKAPSGGVLSDADLSFVPATTGAGGGWPDGKEIMRAINAAARSIISFSFDIGAIVSKNSPVSPRKDLLSPSMAALDVTRHPSRIAKLGSTIIASLRVHPAPKDPIDTAGDGRKKDCFGFFCGPPAGWGSRREGSAKPLQ